MAEYAEKTLGPMPGEKKIWAVGERVGARLADARLPAAAQFTVPSSVSAITSLVGKLQLEIETQAAGADAEVYVFHTRPAAGGLNNPVSQRLLPLDVAWQKSVAQRAWPTRSVPQQFGHEAALRGFVREYLFISLFKACAESLASENASRLAAMQRAEKNIDSLLVNLNRTFYRLRQNSIDEELFDVISGFNALSQKAAVRTTPGRPDAVPPQGRGSAPENVP